MSHLPWGRSYQAPHWPRGALLLCNMQPKRGLDPALNLSPSPEKPISVGNNSPKLGHDRREINRVTSDGREQKPSSLVFSFLPKQRPPLPATQGSLLRASALWGEPTPTSVRSFPGFPVPVRAPSLGPTDTGHGCPL